MSDLQQLHGYICLLSDSDRIAPQDVSAGDIDDYNVSDNQNEEPKWTTKNNIELKQNKMRSDCVCFHCRRFRSHKVFSSIWFGFCVFVYVLFLRRWIPESIIITKQ